MRRGSIVAGLVLVLLCTATFLFLGSVRISQHEEAERLFHAEEIMVPTLVVEDGWVKLSDVEVELWHEGAIFTKEYHVPLHHLLFREGIEFTATDEKEEVGEGVDWGSEEELLLGASDDEVTAEDEDCSGDEEEDDNDSEGLCVEEEYGGVKIDEVDVDGGVELTKKQRKKLKKREKKEEKRRAKEEKKWRNSHLFEIKLADLNSEARREMIEYATEKLSKLWQIPLPSWRNEEIVLLSQAGITSQCPGMPRIINLHRYYKHPKLHGRTTYSFKSSSEDLSDGDSEANAELYLPISPKIELLKVLEHDVARSELGQSPIDIDGEGTFWYLVANEGEPPRFLFVSDIRRRSQWD